MPHPRAWKPFILAAATSSTRPRARATASCSPGVTLANQAGAVLVHRTDDERRRKWIVGATVAIDLGVLGVFKYYGFFVDEVGAFLDSIGLGMPLPLLTLALPIGLSFITFQAISYVVDVKRGLLPPASTARLRALPELLPARGGRADRAGARVHPAAAEAARPARRGRGRRRGADRARAGQEGRARRLPGPRGGRPGVRRARGLRRARRGAGRLRLRGPDLLRLLRLHRHRDRRRAADGLRVPAELQQPLPRHQLPRVLAALAHDAVALPARLPLHPARRQPRRQVEDRAQPDDHDGARRALARRGLGLRPLGRACTAPGWWSSASCAAASTRPAWLRWAIVFNLVVFGWILFRAENLDLAGTFISRLVDPGRGHALDARSRWPSWSA